MANRRIKPSSSRAETPTAVESADIEGAPAKARSTPAAKAAGGVAKAAGGKAKPARSRGKWVSAPPAPVPAPPRIKSAAPREGADALDDWVNTPAAQPAPAETPASRAAFLQVSRDLMAGIFPLRKPIRLLGVSMSHFETADQPTETQMLLTL